MFQRLGSLITIETPISDEEAPVQGAGVADLIARPDGGFSVLYVVGVDDLVNPTRTLFLRSFDAAGKAESKSVTIDMLNSYSTNVFGRFGNYDNHGVVLFGQRNDTTTLSLREYSPTGKLLDGPDPILTAYSPSVFISDAAKLTGNRSFVLYQDDFNGDTLIRGRIFSADNSPAGKVITLSSLTGVDQSSSKVEQLSNGKIAIAYTQSSLADSGDIYAMIRTSTGAASVSAFRVNSDKVGRQSDTDIAALDSGGFVVSWTSSASGYDNVYARVFDGSGKAATKQLQVSKPGETYQDDADVVAVSGGRFAVIWSDSLANGQIKAQLFDRLGSKIGSETILTKSAAPGYYDQSPRATEISNGILAFAWTRDIEQEGILAYRYDLGQAGTKNADTLDAKLLGRVLEGFAGNDRLIGSASVDEIIGGAGRDRMTGKAQADHFIFQSVHDLGKTATTRDVITDFGQGADVMDLHAIDAIAGGKDCAFKFIGTHAFTGVDGQLHFIHSGTKTLVEGDINGDKKADFQIELTGHLTLDSHDFIL